jgi:hypothetical protein
MVGIALRSGLLYRGGDRDANTLAHELVYVLNFVDPRMFSITRLDQMSG